jgi:diketogulonate reductase-like aldo/keto reductase
MYHSDKRFFFPFSVVILVSLQRLLTHQRCHGLVVSPMSRREALLQPVLTSTLISTATNTISPTVTLADQTTFPVCSFGLQIYNDQTAYQLTRTALKVGYRNFFASVLAGNQKGFAQAIRDSGIPRHELYICGSVVSNRVQGFDAAYQATTKGWQRNLIEFAYGNIDYLDQIMLDYPGPDVASIQGQWKAFEEMHQQQKVKSLSVSNFSTKQLDAVLAKAQVKPVVNQLPFSVAYHPNMEQILTEHRARDIIVQAWAPLGKSLGGRFNAAIRQQCAVIGRQYNKTWAQVALRWILQKGVTFTTQSQNPEHFAQDLDLFDFVLSDSDMAVLDSLT